MLFLFFTALISLQISVYIEENGSIFLYAKALKQIALKGKGKGGGESSWKACKYMDEDVFCL